MDTERSREAASLLRAGENNPAAHLEAQWTRIWAERKGSEEESKL